MLKYPEIVSQKKKFAQYLAQFGEEFFILWNMEHQCQKSKLIKER